jgi:hypothetical protein
VQADDAGSGAGLSEVGARGVIGVMGAALVARFMALATRHDDFQVFAGRHQRTCAGGVQRIQELDDVRFQRLSAGG